PMARHLQDAGHTVITSKFHIPPHKDLVDNGLKIVDSPKALAETVDTIILMLPDTPEVEDVLFGENGVSYGLSAGKLVIDMSSISPIATKEFARNTRATAAKHVHGPVWGGEGGAENAAHSLVAGGSQESSARALPLFQLMGKSITLSDDCGDG